jgi:hypothetical protein
MDARQANAIKNRASLRPSQALRAAFAKRGKGVGTITYFYSAKNERDLVFPSDLQFAHGLLLEADESVKSYESDPDRVIAYIEREGYVGSKPDAIVTLWSGRTRYDEAKYVGDRSTEHAQLQAETQRRAAEAVGASWTWFSEEDVLSKDRLLHDWIHIAPVLNQARIDVKARWNYLASWVLEATRNVATLGELKRLAQDPWELVFATTFGLVQRGRLRTNLEAHPLSAATEVAPKAPRHA